MQSRQLGLGLGHLWPHGVRELPSSQPPHLLVFLESLSPGTGLHLSVVPDSFPLWAQRFWTRCGRCRAGESWSCGVRDAMSGFLGSQGLVTAGPGPARAQGLLHCPPSCMLVLIGYGGQPGGPPHCVGSTSYGPGQGDSAPGVWHCLGVSGSRGLGLHPALGWGGHRGRSLRDLSEVEAETQACVVWGHG